MLLSVVLFLPLVFAAIIAVWPQKNTLRHLALGLSLIEFLASLVILKNFDQNSAALQIVRIQFALGDASETAIAALYKGLLLCPPESIA